MDGSVALSFDRGWLCAALCSSARLCVVVEGQGGQTDSDGGAWRPAAKP